MQNFINWTDEVNQNESFPSMNSDAEMTVIASHGIPVNSVQHVMAEVSPESPGGHTPCYLEYGTGSPD